MMYSVNLLLRVSREIQLRQVCPRLVQYYSSAFFIRHEPSTQEFLFFGDLEPDVVAKRPQTLSVWRTAAEMISDRLNTIFIECSWPSGLDDKLLFGRLTPEHLVQKLETIAYEIVNFRTQASPQDTSRSFPMRKRQRTSSSLDGAQLRGALDGLRVFFSALQT